MGSVVSGIGGGLSTLTGGGGGGNSGKAGMNYSAGSAPIVNPANQGQADQTYADAQRGLNQQQAFLQAVQGQNGLQNQSSVFNQLQGVANGTGANPAQAMLNQQTGTNVANQAALMAGQRGAGANAGLLARQAAMQGANTQQQAVGQGATMQANQSLNALNQMGGLATNQANQLSNANNSYSQAAQGEQANIGNMINGQNSANVSNMGSQNSANAGIANTVAGGQQALLGNVAGGIGSAIGLAQGGVVPTKMADGGDMGNTTLQAYSGPQSMVGQYMSQSNPGANMQANTGQPVADGMKNGAQGGAGLAKMLSGPAMGTGPGTAMAGGAGDSIAALGPAAMLAAEGGRVPALLSPGEKVLSPEQVQKAAGGKIDPMKEGKTVPGKPKVGGAKNDYANDTVPAQMEPGSVVIPRAVTKSKNPSAKSIAFVHAIAAKHGLSVMPKKGK